MDLVGGGARGTGHDSGTDEAERHGSRDLEEAAGRKADCCGLHLDAVVVLDLVQWWRDNRLRGHHRRAPRSCGGLLAKIRVWVVVVRVLRVGGSVIAAVVHGVLLL